MGTMTRLVKKLDETTVVSAAAPIDKGTTAADIESAPSPGIPATAATPSRFETEPPTQIAVPAASDPSLPATPVATATPSPGAAVQPPPLRKSLFTATRPDVEPIPASCDDFRQTVEAQAAADGAPVKPTDAAAAPEEAPTAPPAEPDVSAFEAAEAAIDAGDAATPDRFDPEPVDAVASTMQSPIVESPPLNERPLVSAGNSFVAPAAAIEEPARFAAGPTCTLTPAAVSASIIAIRQPFSAVAEQIRGAAARLTSMNPSGEPTALAITSSVRREGKSVFCANLALMLAEGGHRRVVVIDCDLRAGTLAALLGARNELGWADVLRGDASLAQAIQPTTQRGLYVLSAGRMASSSPGELLGGRSLPDSIARLREQADYVIIDTPAVTACADATLIARACDAALLIVAAGRTPESMIENAASTLRGNSVRILGAVMTACEHRSIP